MGEFLRDRLPDPASYFDGEGIELKGPGKWRSTRCEFHGGSDSMRINVDSGGWCCMNCGEKGGDVLAYHLKAHGLDFVSAAKALGAWQEDEKPYRGRSTPRKLPAGEALELLYQDCLLVWVAAGNLANGVALTDRDRADLGAAHRRVWLVSQEAQG